MALAGDAAGVLDRAEGRRVVLHCMEPARRGSAGTADASDSQQHGGSAAQSRDAKRRRCLGSVLETTLNMHAIE